MTTSADLAERIVVAALERRLAPGAHLREQRLAALFGCSRTIVREALTALAARGLVRLSSRRGWFLLRPDAADAQAAFRARRALETGIIASVKRVPEPALGELRAHVALQKAVLASGDAAYRSRILGDFHVCLARALGHGILAQTLRDLTVRTTLVAQAHQGAEHAARSCAEHEAIVQALQDADIDRARHLLDLHLATWSAKLHVPQVQDDLAGLRPAHAPSSLSPVPFDTPVQPVL